MCNDETIFQNQNNHSLKSNAPISRKEHLPIIGPSRVRYSLSAIGVAARGAHGYSWRG